MLIISTVFQSVERIDPMAEAAVLVLRREWDEIPEAERALYIEALRPFGMTELFPEKVDSADADEHLANCRDAGSPDRVAVILPKETPVPLLAMREGYDHITTIDGKVMKLVGVTPVFVPYEPGS